MRSLKERLNKLTRSTNQVPELIIYQIGSCNEISSIRKSDIVICLPESHRQDVPEKNGHRIHSD